MFKLAPCWIPAYDFAGMRDTWAAGPPSSAISMAIVIIPNLAGMFNENRTFLRKK
jgi:hypothetical protein